MGSYKYCLCFTRKFRWNDKATPPDVTAAFAACTEGGDPMGPEQLRRFLAEAQDESGATLADAERIIDKVRQLRHRHHLLGRSLLSLDDFHQFLFSDELNAPIQYQVHQDMTAPLSHYYIYTGHNSYLTGNQLSSVCSDVPIIKALQMGVRVIELDMWPNSAKDNVDILHGRTLTSPVELMKCLRSIRDYAFCASPYPLVITLEDHLTPDLQAKVAEMVTQTFGDMLYYPEKDSLKEFPSPDFLKNRIIISTKPPKEYLKSKENDPQKGKDISDEETWDKAVTIKKSELESDDKNEHEQNDQDQDEEDSDDDDDDDDDQSFQQNSAPEYKRLITIHAGKPKGRLRDALEVDPDKVRRLSLSEQQFAKAAASHGTDVVR